MPDWAFNLFDLAVIVLVCFGLYKLGTSPHAKQMRERRAGLYKLQTLFGDDENNDKPKH